ncbi:MAG: ferritin family protein [Anaerolineae bacterium]|jgi:rubrerythrin
MDWNSPKGILRRGMSIERDGYRFYLAAADRASEEHGAEMFRDLAHQEVEHLHLLLVEYASLEAGEGWIPFKDAMERELDFDPADPDLPGEEPPMEDMPVFSPKRECSLEGDIEALDCGLETEVIARELYVQGAKGVDDQNALEAYEFLIEQEEHHYELLQNTRDYLVNNQTWWDSTEHPFFIG